jgi:hypothetical protein
MSIGVSNDTSRGLLVVVRDPRPNPSDHTDMLAYMRRLDDDCHARDLIPICILVVRSGTPVPTAAWRRKFAEHSRMAKCPKLFFALVSDSIEQRGALTAMSWLIGPARAVTLATETFTEARVAAERIRGWPLPRLQELYALAEDELRRRASA